MDTLAMAMDALVMAAATAEPPHLEVDLAVMASTAAVVMASTVVVAVDFTAAVVVDSTAAVVMAVADTGNSAELIKTKRLQD
jgi:hypothetical protein